MPYEVCDVLYYKIATVHPKVASRYSCMPKMTLVHVRFVKSRVFILDLGLVYQIFNADHDRGQVSKRLAF